MRKILTFNLASEFLGIDVSLVKEITRNIEYTTLLNEKKHIKGLMNLRGNIVTILDLEMMLGKKTDSKVTNLQCIVLKMDDNQQIGFLVNKTCDVIEVKEEDFSELPEDIIDAKANYISSVIKGQGELLKILDLHKVFQVETF